MGRIKINKEDRTIFLVFNKNFYNLEAIKTTSNDFNEICTTDIKENKEIEVKLKNINKEADLNTIGYEFYNYVFGIMKNTHGI
jgi:hypothetical protein